MEKVCSSWLGCTVLTWGVSHWLWQYPLGGCAVLTRWGGQYPLRKGMQYSLGGVCSTHWVGVCSTHWVGCAVLTGWGYAVLTGWGVQYSLGGVYTTHWVGCTLLTGWGYAAFSAVATLRLVHRRLVADPVDLGIGKHRVRLKQQHNSQLESRYKVRACCFGGTRQRGAD